MTAISRCRTKITFGFAFAAMVLVWLVMGDASPFKEYFLDHVAIPNILSEILIVPYLFLMLVKPTVFDDAISYTLIFLQWLLIGYVLARLLCKN